MITIRAVNFGVDGTLVDSLDLHAEAERMAQGHDIDAHRSALLERQYMPQIRAFPQVRTLFGRLRQDAVRRVIPET